MLTSHCLVRTFSRYHLFLWTDKKNENSTSEVWVTSLPKEQKNMTAFVCAGMALTDLGKDICRLWNFRKRLLPVLKAKNTLFEGFYGSKKSSYIYINNVLHQPSYVWSEVFFLSHKFSPPSHWGLVSGWMGLSWQLGLNHNKILAKIL